MKKSFLKLGFFALLFTSFIAAGCATTNNPSSPAKKNVSAIVSAGFPEGYQDWANTYSKTVLDNTSPFYGFQRVLVNKIALSVYKNGKNFPYPEGSQLVLEFNEPITEGPAGDVVKGMTNWLALMTKDSKAVNTGGWIFEAYDASKVKKDMDTVTGCFHCHKAMERDDYIFSSVK